MKNWIIYVNSRWAPHFFFHGKIIIMKFAHMWVDTTLATGKVIVLCIHTQQLPFTFHMIIHECCCYRYHHLVVVSQDTSHTSLTVIDGVKLFYQVNATSQTVHQQWQRAWKIFCQASFRWKKMLDWCKKTHFTNYIKLHSSYYYFCYCWITHTHSLLICNLPIHHANKFNNHFFSACCWLFWKCSSKVWCCVKWKKATIKVSFYATNSYV